MVNNNKEFKIIALFLIIGFSLLSFLLFILSFGVNRIREGQTGKVNIVMNHELDPEIAIFGSSVSEVGIDSKIVTNKTKKSCYNLSINGTRFSQYKCLIDELNSYSKNNKTIVLVETYFSFEPIDQITSLDFYLAHIGNENIYVALHKIDPELIWKSRYIPFYKFIPATHIYYKNAIKGWINYLNNSNNIDTLQGYTPVNRDWELDADLAIKKTTKFDIIIQEEIVRDYEQNILKMQKLNKKVIIVLTPMYSEKFKLVTNIKPLIAVLKKIASNTNAIFLDFSSSKICDDKINFYNSNHLNLRGSKIFSNQIADSLNSIFSKNIYN